MSERRKPGQGLLPEQHKDLNCPSIVYPGGEAARNAKIEELRAQHANNPVALQQIDVYDGRTRYNKNIRHLVNAIKAGDQYTVDELITWFNKHYPDIR